MPEKVIIISLWHGRQKKHFIMLDQGIADKSPKAKTLVENGGNGKKFFPTSGGNVWDQTLLFCQKFCHVCLCALCRKILISVYTYLI